MKHAVLTLLLPVLVQGAEATLILHHGKILTADPRFTVADAVAVNGNRIVAVGSNDEILKRYQSKQAIDLKGKMVLPGLIDAHVHAVWAGQSELRSSIPPLDSFASIQNYIKGKAQDTPKGEWIVVPRTFPTRLKEMRMPTRDVLDVAPDHPVLFDASYVWVLNSAALKKVGITRDTPNPPGGEIGKRADGEPNGILRNASKLVRGVDVNGVFTKEDKLKALEDQLNRYLDAGLTAVGDRAVIADEIAVYEDLHLKHRLPVRVVLTWRPDSQRPVDEVVKEIKAAPFTTNTGDDWLGSCL